MSQIATIVSAAPIQWCGNINTWIVSFTYALDAGGVGTAEVRVGANGVPPTEQSNPTTPFWSGPNTTVQVNPQPPGTVGPVLLPVPPLVQWAAFNVQQKGFPNA